MNKTLFIVLIGLSLTFGWDYLYFVQLWPGSWIYEDKLQYNFTNDYFSIHGIWPQDANGSWPGYCNQSLVFNETSLNPIKNDLSKYWTNFINASQLWEHEFYRHYTCAAQDPNIGDELEYYNLGLELRNKTDLFNIFVNNSIVPSNEKLYDLDSVQDAINNALNLKTVLICDRYNIINEIILCINKNLEFMNCSGMVNTNCRNNVWFNKT